MKYIQHSFKLFSASLSVAILLITTGCPEPDECKEFLCDNPPDSYCDGNTIVTYAGHGICVESDEGPICEYPATREDCNEELVCLIEDNEPACVPPPTTETCDDIEPCDDPPDNYCDGNTIVTYAEHGICVESDEGPICEYSVTREDCDQGHACLIEDNEPACVQPPTPETCADIEPCDDPPDDYCDGNTIVTYSTEGTCIEDINGARCEYSSTTLDCDPNNACEIVDGEPSCVSTIVTCADIEPCDNPPAAYCDGNTLITYSADGICIEDGNNAECIYESTSHDCGYEYTCEIDGSVADCVPVTCPEGYEPCEEGCCEIPPSILLEGGGPRIRGRIDMAVDADGNPHMVFFSSTDHMLKYAHRNGEEWAIETLDFIYDTDDPSFLEGTLDEQGIIHPSIALDSQNRPHVAYRNDSEGLKYARRDETGWTIQLLDDSYYVSWGRNHYAGYGSSIAIDEDDNPHIFHFTYAEDSTRLRLLSHDGTDWVSRDVGNGLRYGTVLEIDNQQRFHLLYRRSAESDHELVYAHRHLEDDDEWSKTTFPIQWSMIHNDMGINADGVVSIAYSPGVSDQLHVFNKSNGEWTSTIIPELSRDVVRTTVNSEGIIHVSYRGSEPGISPRGLMLARLIDGEWEFRLIEEKRAITRLNHALILKDDEIHLAFRRWVSSSLVWIWDDGEQHIREVAYSPEPLVGTHSSMVMASDGILHAIYLDFSNLRIRHAQKNTGGQWHIETVPISGSTVTTLSRLQIGTDDSLHLFYLDDLKLNHLRYDGTQWQEELVSTGVHNFGFQAFALDQNNQPHVIYAWRPYPAGSQNLRKSYLDGSSWITEDFMVGQLVTSSASGNAVLAFNSGEDLHIVMAAHPTVHNRNHILHVYEQNEEWTIETIDDSQSFPGPLAFYFNENDVPMVAYNYTPSFFSGSMYLATLDAQGWSIEEILTDMRPEGRINMVHGNGCSPRLTFHDSATKHMKMATFSGNQWETELLSPDGIPGGLVMDTACNIHIGYYTNHSRGYYYMAR